MSKILITGAAGFIGRQLSESLINQGHSVVEVDDLSIQPIIEPKDDLIIKKVEDIDSNFLVNNNISSVIHLAAKKNVKDSFYNLNYSTENYDMTHKLLNACTNSNVLRFYLASTCEIFGYQSNQLDESSQFNPHSPYAVSKVANEYLSNVYMMFKRDFKVTSLVFFNTYGPSEGRDAVIPNFISKAIKGEKIFIEGDGNQARDFTYIDDTIELLSKVIKSDKYYRYLNIGTGADITINKLVEIIKSKIGNIEVKKIDSRPNEVQTFVADNNVIKNEFGFFPKVDINLGIKKVIDFYNNLNGKK